MESKKILIIVNAVLYNRGSEALVQGFVSIIKKKYPDSLVTVASSESDFESRANIPYVDNYIDKNVFKSEKSLVKLLTAFLRKSGLSTLSYKIQYQKVIRFARRCDIVFVVGADNYDSTYGMYNALHGLNLLLKKNSSSKLVLFDCSLEENHISSKVIEDINLFDAVTARESITFENFKKYIDDRKVKYFPDPAFVLGHRKCKLPKGWQSNNMVGINLSSLVIKEKYGSNESLVLRSYIELIKYIINDTPLTVVLIPHVMQGADLVMLKILKREFEESERVLLIDDESLNAAELKYIISKCRFFIGARTHATIAAYSSHVPTLVLGYSIKSRGIARDLFGSEENYVIPVSKLKSQQELVEGFKWIQDNENSIRQHLENVMPGYKSKTWEIGTFISNIFDTKM